MPTIVFASSKGGVGKTTAAVVLADQLARSTTVSVIDADPNRPIKAWSEKLQADNLTVVSDANEDNVMDRIEEAQGKSAFVLVDLEGSAAKIVLLAISQADLVLIPSQGSHLDAEQAGRTLKVIRQHKKMAGREVPHAILLTRTSPIIQSRSMSHIRKSLADAGVPELKAQLNEREAFKAMFSFSSTLAGLKEKDVPNVPKAEANAEAYAAEVIAILRANRAPQQ